MGAKGHSPVVRAAAGALLVFFLYGALPCFAAVRAQEHTVLYYLIETQRRFTRTCDGRPMPEAPSLTPSEALREICGEVGENTSLAAERGLAGQPYFIGTVPGQNARQVFDALLRSGQCESLMDPRYTYIGASQSGGNWTVLLSAVEPVRERPMQAWPPEPGNQPDQAWPDQAWPDRPGGPSPGSARPFDGGQPETRPGVTPLRDTRPPEARGSAGDNTAFGVFANEPPPSGPDLPPAPGLAPLEGLGGAPQGRDEGPPPAREVFAEAPATPTARNMLTLINAARSRPRLCGQRSMPAAPALREDPRLFRAARDHAALMSRRAFFSSTTPDGQTLGQRVTAAGYEWAFVAENIAARVADPGAVLDSWLSREDQCANIMAREFSQTGAAYDEQGRIWVFIVATPMP